MECLAHLGQLYTFSSFPAADVVADDVDVVAVAAEDDDGGFLVELYALTAATAPNVDESTPPDEVASSSSRM